MIILLWILLTMLPMAAGWGILSVIYKHNKGYQVTISECYLLGFLCCIGIAEIAHAAGLFMDMSLEETGIIFATILLAVIFISVTVTMFLKARKVCIRIPAREQSGWMALAVLVAVFLLQTVWMMTKENIVTPGDITLETVQSFLAQDGIYRVMPLTGKPSEQGMPLRYTVLCLPTLYAFLCQMFETEPELLVTRIIPVIISGASYFAYYRLSSTLFGEEKKKERLTFLAIVMCIMLFSDSAAYMDGYSILHSGYLGTSIRNLVLVPYAVSASLEGRWWKSVLCILAEACIAWTFWGCGVCLVITVGILLVTIADKRFPRLHNFMQIFRDKGELP